MFRFHFFLFFIFSGNITSAQIDNKQLQEAVARFANDPQLENAIFSLCVMDASSGAMLYARNENIGLAPASCLKLVTSATGYELLGKDYTFDTKILYTGSLANGLLNGSLVIQGSGDPSLGCTRWDSTSTSNVLKKITKLIKAANIKKITGGIIIVDGNNANVTPSNWIWEDLGNYYGAPARLLNWRENQYDLHFATGRKIGDSTKVVSIDPEQPDVSFVNYVTTADAESGDNSLIYLPPTGNFGMAKGTLPANSNDFVVSGAMPNPTSVFGAALKKTLTTAGISIGGAVQSTAMAQVKWTKTSAKLIGTIQSPSFEKLNFWFMRRSINLYGEAFINRLAMNKLSAFETDKGVTIVKDFWKTKGISPNALNLYDGSGLSPANRVTTKSLAAVLFYATSQNWYESYYEGFPTYNEMKLKSGTIGDVKGFSGYHTTKDGNKLIISFLVNNYNGSKKTIVAKMFKVLDVLK